MLRRINLALYALIGVVTLVSGAIMLVAPQGTSAGESHMMQELGTSAVLVGLLAFWCIPNYERRGGIHAILIVSAALMALVHWYDFAMGQKPWLSPVSNSVPVLVLVGMALSGYLERKGDGE